MQYPKRADIIFERTFTASKIAAHQTLLSSPSPDPLIYKVSANNDAVSLYHALYEAIQKLKN